MVNVGTLAFVAGATGYVGQYVVQQLSKQDISVVAHIRPDSKRLAEWCKRLEIQNVRIDTTVWSVKAMAETFRRLQPSVIFCLIGTTRSRMSNYRKEGQPATEASYEAIDYGLTQILIDAAQQADIQPQFVYLSAMGTSPQAKGAYMKARYKAEQAVIYSDLPYTILRPAIITGSDREESRLAEQWGGKILDGILTIGKVFGFRSAANYRSISGKGLADVLVQVVLNSELENRIIERQEFEGARSAESK